MLSEPTILAFDTSAAHCAAALLRGNEILVSQAEGMNRGQAERLMPLLNEVLEQANLGWNDLDAIGVGVGPGNFTGIRISVSAARGLALGLDAPAVGVNAFEALATLAPEGQTPAVQGPRDQVYLQTGETPARLLAQEEAQAKRTLFFSPNAKEFVIAIARVALTRWTSNPPPPAPFYVKAADAAPSRDVPPSLLDA